MSELLGYEELAVELGKSVGAVRNMQLRGQLPEQDAPGPKWRRSTLAEILKEGAPVPADVKLPDGGAADRSAAPEPRSGACGIWLPPGRRRPPQRLLWSRWPRPPRPLRPPAPDRLPPSKARTARIGGTGA